MVYDAGAVTAAPHRLTDDPLVHPGMPGTSHSHDFLGALSTDAYSTADSLRAGGTCSGTSGDTAAYWTPTLYVNAHSVDPSASGDRDGLAYYKQVAGGTSVQPFPDGFAMILGNSMATSAAENPDIAAHHIEWKCGPGGAPRFTMPPTSCASGSFLVAVFTFPQFWDGTYTPGVNAIADMSYSKDAAHPIALPRLQFFERFSTLTGSFGTIELAHLSDGTRAPYFTAHMDFLNGWDQARLAGLVSRCIDGNVNCGTDPA